MTKKTAEKKTNDAEVTIKKENDKAEKVRRRE